MKVILLSRTGFNEALLGIYLSYHRIEDPNEQTCTTLEQLIFDNYKHFKELSDKLLKAGSPHDKFSRAININIFLNAPTYFLLQFDTYKVGTTSQSESKMHTLLKYPISYDMFEYIPEYLGTNVQKNANTTGIPEELMNLLTKTQEKKDFATLLRILPMSFLQSRIVNLNLAVLRNMYKWRHDHKLKEWHMFLDYLKKEMPYIADTE